MEKELRKGHPIEQEMGMIYYCSKTDGIGGKLRNSPFDFIVEEILPEGRKIDIFDERFSLGKDEPGLFTEFILIKKAVESHRALTLLSEELGVSTEDINFAGTKDKMAYTAQRATVFNVPKEKLLDVNISGLEIRAPRTTVYRNYLGNLYGNHFIINIKELEDEKESIKYKIHEIKKEIDRFGGIPNYFGHQRFGARRPISHEVGKQLILNNVEEAVRLYLGKVYPNESDAVKKARAIYNETDDCRAARKAFPNNMFFERRILEYLEKRANDFIGAFYTLPKNLMKIYVHAYQSYIWNLTVSKIMKEEGNFKRYFKKNKKKTLPIVGYKTNLKKCPYGEYIKELLAKDGVKQKNFKIKKLHHLKLSGTERAIAISPKNLTIKMNQNQEIYVTADFTLESGSYATVVLREIMKTNPIDF
ncbi:MAG: tRNA pseudouridine(13) synthase TruD [Asgard group archaeon]|nr:tRNA pseudouridine(13) synthase TruD [Asgard group archaeon]